MASAALIQKTMRKVRVADANIAVSEWGSGPPVLMLHGNPDSGEMWEEIAGTLGRGYRCVAPDLPGFGRSEVPTGFKPTLDGMALFVAQFLESAGVGPPINLIAHDFGGPFGFAWAVKHPGSVRRMVAINTLVFSDYKWHFWARVWRTPVLGELSMAVMNRPMFSRELRRRSGSRISDEHIARTWALMTPRMKKQVLRLYRASDPAGFEAWERPFLSLTVAKPTLVIWGDKDPYISALYAERFNARKVAHLPRVGHWPPVEAGAECAEIIQQFFSEGA